MQSILVGFGVLLALAVARRALPWMMIRFFPKSIGDAAMARQPDTIHLTRTLPSAWTDGDAMRQLEQSLAFEGFRDAGVHRIHEMPGVLVQLMADENRGMYAAVYEHPQAGRWVDVVSRYPDGTSYTITSSAATGLETRPGHRMAHATGAGPKDLVARLMQDRPRGATLPARVGQAKDVFESAYADSIAWRKGRGVSSEEIGRVARRKAA